MANEKLNQVVQVVSRIQLLTEGGWQYSSPLIREEGEPRGIPLLETPDSISLVQLVVGDIDQLHRELVRLVEDAKGLGIDTVTICGADIAAQARAYQQLAMDLGTAAQRALETMREAPAPRRRRANLSTSDRQTKLPTCEEETPSEPNP